MINIDSTTVAVETSDELKEILEGNNEITLIYFAKDITLTRGISILTTKKTITIDGLYPTDGTGTIHTYTDMNSAGSGDTIGVRGTSSINVIVQNLNVIGRNYYGIIYVPDGTAYQNIVITYKNITYRGPQITYHPSGLSIYENLDITIVDSTAVSANEVAETYQLQIKGKNKIVHNSTANSAFWFRGSASSPYLEILEGAEVSLTTTRDVAYTASYLKISINKNASFIINTKYGFFRDNGHQASSILVDENSKFSIIQTNSNAAMISCRGDFTINENAILLLQANFSTTSPLIRFVTTSAKLNITKPKSIILYNQTGNCFTFENQTAFNITAGRIDYWLTSPTLSESGEITGKALYSWNKLISENIIINTTQTSSKTTIVSNNLTTEEIAKMPSLDLLQYQTAKTLRIIPVGNVEIQSAPTKIEFQRPVLQTNPVILGRKDEEMQVIIKDTRALSEEWYLYAYVDTPLTTSDEKYSLPDSLIFIGEDNTIETLSKEPILVYTGTGNEGDTKITTINWEQSKGILFKVIEPLYNGETYSTLINWIISAEKL